MSSCCRPLTPPAQGCHTGGTAITAKIVTWAPVDTAWVPEYDTDGTTILNEAAAGGGGGPHNDPVWDTALESGATEYPLPSYDVEPVRSLRLLHPPLPRHQPAWRGHLEVHDLRVQAAVQRLRRR